MELLGGCMGRHHAIAGTAGALIAASAAILQAGGSSARRGRSDAGGRFSLGNWMGSMRRREESPSGSLRSPRTFMGREHGERGCCRAANGSERAPESQFYL